MEKNSLTRLNDYKIETNQIISGIGETTYYLNSIKSRYINAENIGKSYENKVYKIYTDLEKKGIDFWSDEFEFREAILSYLQTRLFYGAIILKNIELNILDNKLKSLVNKRISIGKTSKIMSELEKIHVANEKIIEYDIDNNLLDTLIEHFIIMPEGSEYFKNIFQFENTALM